MGQVSVTINGRSYKIACDDGQEPHVEKLAAYLDDRASELAAELGRREGESLVLVLAGLLVVDELADARAELARIQSSAASGGKESETAASGLAALADRIEGIAERLASP
jgi:cell division protein ZapA